MGKIERWIRQKLGSAVAAGSGEWAASPPSNFGQPIYKFADGSMTLTLSELGFSYDGPTPGIERRYDEVEALELAPLENIMRLRGDLNAPITIGVIIRGASVPVEMRWPLRVYSNVATVLDRIVRELA
ncbi:hypothetical protein EWE75_08715 [Sphingomonas populi]|uniref:Uncharacterized protein n=1 Tax=Sphingomonas populi TaxID=2484750 RepID=A0A4Q6Y3S2_9SPHN|nr:hypothetical protein [Sphingomonas populi]RZF64932.1 hypothetical protein EWE75_08715 [Sphingomonas populi]